MKLFAALYSQLDASTATNAKVVALKTYFETAEPADAAWATYFLAGGKPRQAVPTKLLRQAALDASGLSPWLFEESYQAVGDLAETIATVLPPPTTLHELGLAQWLSERLLPLRGAEPNEVVTSLCSYWAGLDIEQRFLMNKLITGGFRVGVSKLLLTRGLHAAFGVDKKVLAQRLMGFTDAAAVPTSARYLALIDASEHAAAPQQSGQPYPFFLAHQLLREPGVTFEKQLGAVSHWQVEWKWDGIRAQLVKRNGQWWLWSRGEELITDRFPELAELATVLPDGTVLDGEILAWDSARNVPYPFGLLQQRIGRKTVTAKVLKDAPVALLCYDLLEQGGSDIRMLAQTQRRTQLEALAGCTAQLKLSSVVLEASWDALQTLREQSRARGVEGFMLKASDSRYGVGRTKADGVWWKWKIDPLTIDCVLIYAQRGHGRRASLYTDYTFAVWHDGVLVPFAKAYSGLTDAEFKRVDEVIRKTTIDKFGPVRSVTPTLVFELGFEGIQSSPRHKSGIAVRFPRILRWREDKGVSDADTLAHLKALVSV